MLIQVKFYLFINVCFFCICLFSYIGGFHKDQAEKFRHILEAILKQEDNDLLVEGLKSLIETIVHENVSLVISRQLLSEISSHVPKLSDEIGKSVCSYALSKIQPRVISFEEQVASVRQHLADIYEREQCWKEAANVLVGIPLETGQKYIFINTKFNFL